MTTYADIAAYYIGLARPLSDAVGNASYPEGSSAGVAAQALSQTVHRAQSAVDRMKEEAG